ncbi:hypothetical protein ABEB36_003318 [Hypothenemus hampei]|uniref:Uncharacterized protein n=1 Tax=Hypothenemus hampei TaxID=57062 RepID=A0ABD1F8S1_HYPHA
MHSKLLYIFVSVLFVYYVQSARLTNNTERRDQLLVRNSRDIGPYFGLINCAMKYDVSCFIDAAEDYLEVKRNELLAQADVEVLKATGRSDSDSKPSHLADSLSRLLSELTGMFQKGISGIFEVGKDLNDDDAVENGSDLINATGEDTNGVARSSKNEVSRHKSGSSKEGLITKIIRVVKLGLYSLVLFLFITSVLMMFNAFVGFKMLLVSMWGVALLALKVYLSYKHEGGTVVVHEDVHHDHHYEDEHHFLPDWHRNYLPKDESYAQKIAYGGQKPTSSWTSWLD